MRNELALEAIIDDYLSGKLSEEEAKAFEELRANDPSVDHKVVSHQVFLASLKDYGAINSLKNQMNAIHETMDIPALKEALKPKPSMIVQLWKNHKSAIAVAASFALLAMVSIYSIQYNTKQNGSYEVMSRELVKIKNSQNKLIKNLNNSTVTTVPTTPAKVGGTGFALTTNGYICTNLHVISGADSVYVQNSKGEAFKAKVVYQDPQYDLAILKIVDQNFSTLSTLPYKLKSNNIGMGENVYTLGFPKDDAVLGEGYVSSKTGHAGDTTAYQVSIPVNPGNSGGPLLDNEGNVIGVISAREYQVEGAAFAVKSQYILEALGAIPQDSLGKKVTHVKKSPLQGLTRTKQIEKIEDYVFMVKVYN
ncbi:S1C family serine protease [Pedobacter sp.]|uniref:S1C family serine protease n=1 Tax=Pedobacter sp. TaxID=1411316 RepID=UPI003D7FD2C1